MFVISCTRPTIEKVATGNFFLADLEHLFFFFLFFLWFLEIHDRKFLILFQKICSELFYIVLSVRSKSVSQPGQEPDLYHMNAALKLHCDVGQALLWKQFFLYQFQRTMRMCAHYYLLEFDYFCVWILNFQNVIDFNVRVPFVVQEIGFLQFVPSVWYDVQILEYFGEKKSLPTKPVEKWRVRCRKRTYF